MGPKKYQRNTAEMKCTPYSRNIPHQNQKSKIISREFQNKARTSRLSSTNIIYKKKSLTYITNTNYENSMSSKISMGPKSYHRNTAEMKYTPYARNMPHQNQKSRIMSKEFQNNARKSGHSSTAISYKKESLTYITSTNHKNSMSSHDLTAISIIVL